MKYIFAILISLFFFALTYSSAPDEFSGIDLSIIVFLLFFVLLLEFLIASIFSRYLILENLILAGFTTINILFVNLVLNQIFIDLPNFGKVLALLLALFILTTLMNFMDENSRIARILPIFIALVVAGVVVETIIPTRFAPKDEVSIEDGKTSAENIRIVDFVNKPNVYFISFDALIPKALLQKHLNLNTTPYHEVLDTHFRHFRNFFANVVPTKESLNSLLALDIQHWWRTEHRNSVFFSGLSPSPLLEIFKHNGYETTTLYDSEYFGRKSGPYVDNYRSRQKLWTLRGGVCEFIDTNSYRALTFLGYCRIIKNKLYTETLQLLGIGYRDDGEQIDFLIDNMRAGIENDVPQFLLAYIFSPGHTSLYFDGRKTRNIYEYSRTFLESSKITASYISKIVNFVDKEDPDAVVYLFGDHGPFLSRSHSFEQNPKFFIQDRFGVYGGVYPRGRCAKSFASPYNSDFITIAQGAHMIIRCLSGGENAFLKLEDYHLPIPNGNNRYEEYTYE